MTLTELFIKISCDSSAAEKGIAETDKKAGALGKTMGGFAKAVTGAFVAAGTAIGKFALDATKAYAEYEQQVGGVRKLFGESADQVIKDANAAFKTAGVDANTYMQNVTSFSASLLKGLGGDTAAAAEISNRAMRDMADNANTFGTNIGSIQNAYQGFAKGNFMMLDNLKLGYGGTKTEMKKLIKDAAAMKDIQAELGITVDKNSMSFANMINAISVMQKHLKIAGTTSLEASTTIQGSLGMMRAAWMNLKIAIADPDGNVNDAVTNLTESMKSFALNAAPTFGRAVRGIGSVIKEVAPVIANELPGLVNDLLPDLIDAAGNLVAGIVDTIIKNAPMIIDGFGQILEKVGATLESSDNPIIQGFGKAISFIGTLIRDPKNAMNQAILWIAEQLGVPHEAIVFFKENGFKNLEALWTTAKGWVSTYAQIIFQPVKDLVEQAKVSIETWSINTAVNFLGFIQDAQGVYDSVKAWAIDTAVNFLGFIQDAEGVYNSVKEWVVNTSVNFIGVIQDAQAKLETVKSWFVETAIRFAADLGSAASALSVIPKSVSVVVNFVKGGFQGAVEAGLGDKATPKLKNTVTDIVTDMAGNISPFGFLFGHAKGDWAVPYDNYPALLHRNEMVLTASQARQYREGGMNMDFSALADTIVSAIRQGMNGATVNSYLDGKLVSDEVSRMLGSDMTARRFA